MTYCVLFTETRGVKMASGGTEWFDSVVPAWKAAQQLDVSHRDLVEAFKAWAEAGYPQEYLHVTEHLETRQGKPYAVGVSIWNYREDGDGVRPWGHVSKAREWGDGLRQISGSQSYNLEAVA